MTEKPQPAAPSVERRDWTPPLLKRLSSTQDIEASTGAGEDAEGFAAS